QCERLTFRASGNLLALGADGMLEWNGSAWVRPVSGTEGCVILGAVETTPGAFVAAGSFRSIGGVNARFVAKHDASMWIPLGNGPAFDSGITKLFVDPAGGIVVAGTFSHIGSLAAPRLARWDGHVWSVLPPAPAGSSSPVLMDQMPNGELVFQDGLFGPRFLAFDGSAWRVLAPPGYGGMVLNAPPMTGLANGDLVVVQPSAVSQLQRWDGAAWSSMTTSIDGSVTGLKGLANGDLVVCGTFTQIDGAPADGIARWHGGQWAAMGLGLAAFGTGMHLGGFVEGPAGELYAIGASNGATLNRQAAKWTGSSWQLLGQGTIGGWDRGIVLPNGDLVVLGVGWLPGNPIVPVGGMASWDGTAWAPFAPGLSHEPKCIALVDGDELVVGGGFVTAGGMPSASFARLVSNCPATSVVTGTACAGSAGPLTLSSTALPWIGGVARGRCDGVANNALAFAITGLSSGNTPLSLLHPAGGATCSLWTSVDAVQFAASVAGSANVVLPIPRDPAFVGIVLRQQFLQAELDVFGGLLLLSSSNALELTVGAL
ncbi:MAG: hypothetical protein KDC48_19025, partial [Planctomycetes bacterium]|nr:hypothetical protein [Planctomycetota bacterium]